MNSFIQLLNDEINQYFSSFDRCKYNTMMDLLWDFYSQHFPIVSNSIDLHFAEISESLNSLSKKKQRKILRITYQLCEECEKEAFLQGIRIGVQVMRELQ